jgi:DNA-directed RNA polymerase subunit K/omega
MENKKTKPETNTITRNLAEFVDPTGNIYESAVVISKRSNQIGKIVKEELNERLLDFVSASEGLEEIYENKEQIEVAKYYEGLPKPTLVAIHEFLNNKTYFRNPNKEVWGK